MRIGLFRELIVSVANRQRYQYGITTVSVRHQYGMCMGFGGERSASYFKTVKIVLLQDIGSGEMMVHDVKIVS